MYIRRVTYAIAGLALIYFATQTKIALLWPFLPPKLYMCSHSICRLDRYYLVCQFKYYPTKLRYSKITRYGMKTGLVLIYFTF